jgi:hypothetical protein
MISSNSVTTCSVHTTLWQNGFLDGNPKPTSPNVTSVTFGDLGLGFPSGPGCVAYFLSFFAMELVHLCPKIIIIILPANGVRQHAPKRAHLVSIWWEEVERIAGFSGI